MIPIKLQTELQNFLVELCKKYEYEYTTQISDRSPMLYCTLISKEYFEHQQKD